ncbi:MAG: hypothetical protein ACOCPN_03870 [Desulfonatronovibrionaceae bacterium]
MDKTPCPGTGSTLSPFFFGSYLLGLGIITREQLDQAVRLQAENNKLLGQLAVEKGYLEPEQVEVILKEQKKFDFPFGAIVLQKQFMTADEMNDLLFAQMVNTTHVGEALVELGFLEQAELGGYLKKYNEFQERRRRSIDDFLEGMRFPYLVRAGIHALDRAFIRFAAEPVTMVSTGGRAAPAGEWSFNVSCKLDSGRQLLFRIDLSELHARKIAGPAAERGGCRLSRLCMVGRNRMFFVIVKRYFAAHLECSGRHVVQGCMLQAVPGASCPDGHVHVSLSTPVGGIETLFWAEPQS